MSEARKTFPMSTFVSYIKGGESNNSVQELLGYMTQKDIDAEFEPFAAALAKAWIYEQHPELAKMKTGQVTVLGDNVSVGALPGDVMIQVDAIFGKLAEYRTTITEQAAKVQDLETKLAAAEANSVNRKAMAEYKASVKLSKLLVKTKATKSSLLPRKKLKSTSARLMNSSR